MFRPNLEQKAFRADNEFGWTREQIFLVVATLRSHNVAILGGELWWVHGGIHGLIPQRHGVPAVYCWETTRRAGEQWSSFVERGLSETITAVDRWPAPDDLPPDLPGRILYNLTWVAETDFDNATNSAT